MKTRTIALADLHPDPQNARKHNPRNIDMIVESIGEVGVSRSGVIDEDGTILAGNGTFEALGERGIERVQVVETDGEEWVVVQRRGLTEEQKRKLSIADNRASELATWDMGMLRAQDVDIAPFFSEDELSALNDGGEQEAEGTGEDVEPQIDRAAELAEKYGTQLGQVWQLGEHRLACGDCADKAVVEAVMQGEKADLLFTDPPYGVNIGAKNRMLNSFQKAGRNLTDIKSDTISAADLKAMLVGCFTLAKTVLSDKCAVFVCSPQGGELGMMMMMMEAGLEVRHILNWVKNSPTFSMGRLDYEYQHEPILFTWTKTHKRLKRGDFQTSIWPVDKPRHSAEHPTMKPVKLPENALLNHTESGDVCYEPFAGSGTTLIACENLKRKCRAIELDPGYVAVSLERWATLTNQEPKLIH